MSKKEEKQKQRIHREWWFDVEHAAEAEALLNDLAQQGWELESVGLQFAAFKRTEQGALRYACVPNHIDKTDVREDAREVFGKAGWTYILYNSQILVFCAPAGTETPEVPSDSPWARLGFAKRRSRNTAIRYGLLAAGLALLFFLSVRTHL